MKITVVGLIVEGFVTPKKRKIIVKVNNSSTSQILNFPDDKPWDQDQVLKFLAEYYGIPSGEIIWPDYIKIHKEK